MHFFSISVFASKLNNTTLHPVPVQRARQKQEFELLTVNSRVSLSICCFWLLISWKQRTLSSAWAVIYRQSVKDECVGCSVHFVCVGEWYSAGRVYSERMKNSSAGTKQNPWNKVFCFFLGFVFKNYFHYVPLYLYICVCVREMWYRAVVTLLFQETRVLPLQLLHVQHGQPHSVLQTLLHLLLQTIDRLERRVRECVNIWLISCNNQSDGARLLRASGRRVCALISASQTGNWLKNEI